MKNSVLVTGGAGYVGSHCVEQLIGSGFKVVILDNLERGDYRLIHPEAHFVEGDIANRELVVSLIEEYEIDGVFHFAAYAYVGESTFEPAMYFENNTAKTILFLNSVVAAGVKKVVFSSTCATYGVPSELPITELTPQNPINPYGNSKLCVELYLRDLARFSCVSVTVLRYFNACGASSSGSIGELHDPETHIIPLLLQVAAGHRKEFILFGDDYETQDGTCVRDYIHVSDLASAHVLAYANLAKGFEVFNLGSETPCSIFELIDVVEIVTGRDIPYVVEARRKGDPPVLFADTSKVRNQLGWQAEWSSIENIVTSAWKWYCKNES